MTKSETTRLRNRSRMVLFAALCALGSAAANAQQMPFQLLAGGWSGDGGQATAANLYGAADVVFDKSGNLYVAQYEENRIRKITPAGVISTVAGGNTGFAGDGGPANKALISRPQGLVFDAAGNLFFGDVGNRRVRRIATNGTITTVAGNGAYVSSGDGGQAINAGILFPGALAIDAAGNLFVSDGTAHVIRKVTPGGVISTYAGTGVRGADGDNGPAKAAQLNGPSGIAFDAAGNLYIADSGNHVVRRVSSTGTITLYRDGLMFPDDVEVDANGTVYVADMCKVYRIAGTTTTIMGTDDCGRSPDGTPAAGAVFGFIDGIAPTANGDLYFADGTNARVTKISGASGLTSTAAGVLLAQADGTPALSGTMTVINALAVDATGNVYASETRENRIRRLSAGKLYNFTDGIMQPTGVATSTTGQVFVAARKVWAIKNGVTSLFAGGGADRTSDNAPATTLYLDARGIATDASNNLYIADYNGVRVRKVDPAGMATTIAGNGRTDPEVDGIAATSSSLFYPEHVAVDTDGNVFIYEAVSVIRKVGTDGIIRRFAGAPLDVPWLGGFTGEGGPALDAKLGVVNGMAVHSSGLYLTSECAVRRVAPTGKIQTLGGFPNCALGLSIKGRFLYVSTQNGRVLRAPLPRITPNDFNGDAKSDLVWRASTGTNAMWLGAVNTTTQAIATNPSEWKLVGQGDFDADGKSDLVWRNTSTGANTIWRAGNTNTRIAVPTLTDQAWKVAGVGDFDGDGKSDLFWRNASTGAQQVWYSASAGTRLIVTTQADMQWVLGGVGDFDGDGKSDLLWRNTVTGANAIWRSANSQTPRAIAATNPAWKIAAVADFNGDGASDILWRNSGTGANTIWKSANNTRVQAVVGVTNPNWKVVAAGDYDNDGIADLVWRESNTGANTLWRNANNATQRTMPAVGIDWSVQPYEAQP